MVIILEAFAKAAMLLGSLTGWLKPVALGVMSPALLKALRRAQHHPQRGGRVPRGAHLPRSRKHAQIPRAYF